VHISWKLQTWFAADLKVVDFRAIERGLARKNGGESGCGGEAKELLTQALPSLDHAREHLLLLLYIIIRGVWGCRLMEERYWH